MNTMNMKKPGYAERFGHWLGRVWRGYAGCGRQIANWFVARGVPNIAAIALLWIVKLLVLAVLLYVLFWLVLVLMFVIVVVLGARGADWKLPEPEWKDGPAGFGLYTFDGYRIDPHD